MHYSSYDNLLYRRYLALLGVEPRKPGYDALEELVAAHLKRIPFENVSKLYYLKREGLEFIPDFEKYLSGIERFGFGGTCYSNNNYLHCLLKHLGYDVMLCGADMSQPDVHIVNIVTVEDREYLVDAGYAAPFLRPMPRDIAEDYEISLGRDRYVLHPKDASGRSRMDLYRDGALAHGYTAKPIHRDIEHFRSAIGDSFRYDATFMNSLLLVKSSDHSSTVVSNLSVIRSEGSAFIREELKDTTELVEAIEQIFGIPTAIASEAISVVRKFGNAWS